MGVGGDKSWGARPLDQYLICPGKYGYEFVMIPLMPDSDLKDSIKKAMTISLHFQSSVH